RRLRIPAGDIVARSRLLRFRRHRAGRNTRRSPLSTRRMVRRLPSDPACRKQLYLLLPTGGRQGIFLPLSDARTRPSSRPRLFEFAQAKGLCPRHCREIAAGNRMSFLMMGSLAFLSFQLILNLNPFMRPPRPTIPQRFDQSPAEPVPGDAAIEDTPRGSAALQR